jgi:predicted dehydrogenase
MGSIGIGLIGSGFMGRTYAEALAKHVHGAHLAAITGGKRALQLATEYRVPASESADALLARKDVHGVILAAPNQKHLELAAKAAQAGKHVLVEKPMAPSLAECDAMIAACAGTRVNLAVVKTERFRKVTRKAKELIDDDVIGPLFMLRSVSSFPINFTRELLDNRVWLTDPTSGGLFLAMATRNADLLRWLTGANATRVYAQVNTYSDLPAGAHSVMAQITFDNGVMAQMWICSEFASPGMPSSEVRFQIIGRDAILDLENFDFLEIGKGETWERVYTPEKFDYLKESKSPVRLFPHAGVVQEFVDSIREKRTPVVGGAEGRAAVEICEACLLSARTGQPVDLPLSA